MQIFLVQTKNLFILLKYKSNDFSPANGVLTEGKKIISLVGSDLTNILSGMVSIIKNTINTVNIPKISSINKDIIPN